jgi:hypothetical protein
VKTDRVDEIPVAMRSVGRLIGATQAESAAAALEAAIAREHRQRERTPRLLFAVWTDPLYVAGQDTFTHGVMQLTGGENAVRLTGWPQYSLESLLAAPPDILLYPRGAVSPAQVEALRKRLRLPEAPEPRPPRGAVEKQPVRQPLEQLAAACRVGDVRQIDDEWRRQIPSPKPNLKARESRVPSPGSRVPGPYSRYRPAYTSSSTGRRALGNSRCACCGGRSSLGPGWPTAAIASTVRPSGTCSVVFARA